MAGASSQSRGRTERRRAEAEETVEDGGRRRVISPHVGQSTPGRVCVRVFARSRATRRVIVGHSAMRCSVSDAANINIG